MICLRRGDCEARITRFDRNPWRTGSPKGNGVGPRGRAVAISYVGGLAGTSVLLVFRRGSFSDMVELLRFCLCFACIVRSIGEGNRAQGKSCWLNLAQEG